MEKPILRVSIETFRETGELDSLKSIDWNYSSDRKWLTSHLHWALHNSRQIIITPESF